MAKVITLHEVTEPVPEEVLDHLAEEYIKKGQTNLTFEQYVSVSYRRRKVKQKPWRPLQKYL